MGDSKQGGKGVHEQSETETGIHDSPNPDAAPSESSASDWDMYRTKPSGDSAHTPNDGDAVRRKPPAQQAPKNGQR
jgi:hypothetical protein